MMINSFQSIFGPGNSRNRPPYEGEKLSRKFSRIFSHPFSFRSALRDDRREEGTPKPEREEPTPLPVLRFCEALKRAFPERGYDLALSHDENVFRSGAASAAKWLCSLAAEAKTMEELADLLHSRFSPEERKEDGSYVFGKETVGVVDR